MKKRLLITSIVMMIVVAVVLSTATFAWFTSNTSVSASTMTLKASVSDAAALGIGWTGKAAGTSISSDIYEKLQPMAPKSMDGSSVIALANGADYEYSEGHINFYSSTVKEEAGSIKFNNNGAEQNPMVYHSDDLDPQVDSFYIRNLSKVNTISNVTVKAVFPGGDATYNVTADIKPVTGKNYYIYNGTTFTKVEDATIADGFVSNVTYYELASAYVLSADTAVDVDTTYYTFAVTADTTFEANTYYKLVDGYYTPASNDDVTGNTGTGIYKKTEVADPTGNPSTSNYYEEIQGNDMIRVALFTKRFSVTSDSKAQATKKYYTYNPTTNVITDLGLAENADVPAGAFEAPLKHTLLGILGQEETKFAIVTGAYDMNEVYYTATYGEAEVTEANWAELVAAGLYTKSGDVYTKVSGTYAAGDYYKATSYTKANITSFAENTNYFTATSTVANGAITVNDPVKGLNYYTDVKTSLTVATDLKPNEQVDIIAVVWLDGTMLDDSRASELGQVSLLFETPTEA